MSNQGRANTFFSHLKGPFGRSSQRGTADQWTDMDLSRVAHQARQAYDKKQFKNSFTLTRILLTADPQNAEANALQSALHAAIEEDLKSVRALLADVRLKDDPQVFAKGAEIILKRVLNADPENSEATRLLGRLKEHADGGVPRQPAILAWPADADKSPAKTVADDAPQASANGAEIIPTRVLIVDSENTEAMGLPGRLKEYADGAVPWQPAVWPSESEKAPDETAADHDPQVFANSAEIIPTRILIVDSENTEATGQPKEHAGEGASWQPAVLAWPSEGEKATAETVAAHVHALPQSKPASPPRWTRAVIVSACASILLAMSLLIAGFLLVKRDFPVKDLAKTEAPVPPATRVTETQPQADSLNTFVASAPAPSFLPVIDSPLPGQTALPERIIPPVAADSKPPSRIDDRAVQKPNEEPAAPLETSHQSGMLAANSRSAVEIYMDGKYMGSTPTSIELPPGAHSLEYRSQNLRQVLTHVIRPGETTSAMINFEVTVQINARPWANVFLEGAERRSLGQTPLSELRVPVGGTLSFENPNFTRKTHRITGSETVIQVAFP